MRVLITGAAGFVGRAVIAALRPEHALSLLDIVPLADEPEMLVGDIANFATVEKAMAGVDAVVHLAMAPNDADYRTPELPMRVNVLGTANVLEAAQRARVRRIVHMSSGAVVTGYSQNSFVHVELPFKYSGMYCLTKALEEHLCIQYAAEYGLTIIALRPWSIADGRTMTYRNGASVTYNRGLICRHDLAEACRLGLSVDLAGFQPFHMLATAEAEPFYDMQRTHQVLGWWPKETWARIAPSAPQQ